MLEVDPITKVHDALWALVESSTALNRSIRPGNRAKLDEPVVIKKSVSAADFPELILLPDGGLSNIHATSHSSKLTKRFTWVLSTGELRPSPTLYPVEFALFCAMEPWYEKLAELTWKDEKYIKRLGLLNLAEGASNPEFNRGIKGWVALWSCEVDMVFSKANLRTV